MKKEESREKKPLEWKVEEEFKAGGIGAEINSAILHNGRKRYSIKFYRYLGDTSKGDNRKGFFFRDTDMDYFPRLSEEIKFWIQADQAESVPKNKRKFG